MWNSAANAFSRTASFREDLEDEEELRWAALERLPTYSRARRGIFKDVSGEKKEIQVSELEAQERVLVLDRLYGSLGNDPHKIFDQMRTRFDQ